MEKLTQENEILWNRWCENASKYPDREAIIHWVADEEPFRWTFSTLIKAAEELAGLLLERGIAKGDVCAIIIRHNPHLYPLYLAISCVGAIPAILAYPNPRLHPDKFRQGIEGMSQRSGLDWVFTERELEPVIRPSVQRPGTTIKGLHFPLEWQPNASSGVEIREQLAETHRAARRSDPFLLQHSSGTTGLQKPVLLSHAAVLEHVRRYGEAIKLNEHDKVVSWLPLYHDMGLIAAFHLPLAFGIPSVQIDPFEWVLVPALLLEAVSRERGTISWLPNFALTMMADKIPEDALAGIDLASWRLVINCSEPVRAESNEKFLRRFQRWNLKPSAISACYAMAETTFAATQTLPGVQPPCLALDRGELARGVVKPVQAGDAVRVCVSSGRQIDGCEIRIIDDNGAVVGQGRVGEIAIKSISMFDGYRNYPEKTSAVLRDGWYYSGDYGFQVEEEYYVIGRKKDIIIVAGNNVYPEDVEDVAGKVGGIIPGRVIAFGEEDLKLGSEQISVVAETELTDPQKRKALRLDIIKAGMSIDVTVAKIYLVPPRWLIKSSAGKPSRSANKERLLSRNQASETSTYDHD